MSRNLNGGSLRFIKEKLGLESQDHARRVANKLNHLVNPWQSKSSCVVGYSAGVLPEAEDRIHKYHYYIE